MDFGPTFNADFWYEEISSAEKENDVIREQNEKLLALMGAEWESNFKENAKFFKEGNYLTEIYGTWESGVIIVGSGPSLANSVEQLKRAQGCGWKILSVDGAHKTLKKNGITPDLTASVDSTPRVKEFLELLDESDTVALNVFQSPEVVEWCMSRGAKVVFYSACVPKYRQEVEKYPGLAATPQGAVIGSLCQDMAFYLRKPIGTIMSNPILWVANEMGWTSLEEVEAIRERGTYRGKQLLEISNEDGEKWYSIPDFAHAEWGMFVKYNLFYSQHVLYLDCSKGWMRCVYDRMPLEKALRNFPNNKNTGRIMRSGIELNTRLLELRRIISVLNREKENEKSA